MKRRKLARVGLISIVLLFVLLFSGCDFFVGLFDPLIGTWVYSVEGGSMTMEFHADKSCSWTSVAEGQPTISPSGTYEKTDTTITMTLTWEGDTETITFNYTFSDDKKTLNLTFPGAPFAIPLTKQ
jgi:hypothetical protein